MASNDHKTKMLTCRYVVNMLALDDVNASTKLCFKLNIIFSSKYFRIYKQRRLSRRGAYAKRH